MSCHFCCHQRAFELIVREIQIRQQLRAGQSMQNWCTKTWSAGTKLDFDWLTAKMIYVFAWTWTTSIVLVLVMVFSSPDFILPQSWPWDCVLKSSGIWFRKVEVVEELRVWSCIPKLRSYLAGLATISTTSVYVNSSNAGQEWCERSEHISLRHHERHLEPFSSIINLSIGPWSWGLSRYSSVIGSWGRWNLEYWSGANWTAGAKWRQLGGEEEVFKWSVYFAHHSSVDFRTSDMMAMKESMKVKNSNRSGRPWWLCEKAKTANKTWRMFMETMFFLHQQFLPEELEETQI